MGTSPDAALPGDGAPGNAQMVKKSESSDDIAWECHSVTVDSVLASALSRSSALQSPPEPLR